MLDAMNPHEPDVLPVIGEGLDMRVWRRRLVALRERASRVTATAESEDGLIVATVSGPGRLVDLRLDPRVYRASDSRRLAEQITGVVREATTRAHARIVAENAEILSEGGPEHGRPAV
jgi:DNA-binding protein YbaB